MTINELLEDQQFKKYFLTVPKLPPVPRTSPPWRLYVKDHDGLWRKRDFDKYSEAVKLFARLRSAGKVQDAAVTCRPVAFGPPTRTVKLTKNGKPLMVKTSRGAMIQATKDINWSWAKLLSGDDESHNWCPYCRRPTIFTWFSQHHAIVGAHRSYMDTSARRCTICGIRLEGIGAWARL